MAKTVRVTVDNKIKVLEIPWSLDAKGKAIGADCTETVKTQIMYNLFRDRIVMIVDESGAVKGREINQVASFLYGILNHGVPICGDVLFARQDGPEILPLADAELVKFFFERSFSVPGGGVEVTIREAGKGVVVGDAGTQTYRIGFNSNDETELDAKNMSELEELWRSLCPEFGCKANSVDYVERV